MPFFVLIVALLALTIVPSFWVQAVIKRYREPANRYARTGGQTARYLLDTLGLRNVVAEVTDRGDHYDPQAKAVRLSNDNFYGRSLTAVTIAAHEVGHAAHDLDALLPVGIAPTGERCAGRRDGVLGVLARALGEVAQHERVVDG